MFSKGKILKLLISIVILSLLFFSIDLELIKKINFEVKITDLLSFTFLLALSLNLRAYRWSILINDNQEKKLSHLSAFKILLVGQSLNLILPSGAGDIAKSYYGFKRTGIKERMFSISFLDKLIAIASIAIITPFSFYYTQNYSILIAGFGSLVPFLMFINIKKLRKIEFIEKLLVFFDTKTKKIDLTGLIENSIISTSKIYYSFFISAIAWIITYTLLYKCFIVLNLDISFGYVIATIPFLTLGRLFPFTLNGIGSDEALIIFLFSPIINQSESILIVALLYRVITLIFPALLGIPLVMKNQKLK